MVWLILLFIVLVVIFYSSKKKESLGITMNADAPELLSFTLLIPFLSLKAWVFLVLFTFLVWEGGKQVDTELMV